MIGTDLDQAYRYIELLRNDRNTPVHWQMFNDKDGDSGPPQVFYSSLHDAHSTIQKYQQQGYGAYITINPTDGKGRKIENIIEYNWLFADIDGGQVVLKDYPLKPAFITSRDSVHGHVYWPVTGITSVRQYNYVQKLIAIYLGSDEQVIDPARVARCPGFLHLKDPSNPTSYKIVQDNSDTVDFEYDYDEIVAAFKISDEAQKELDKFVSNRDALTNGSGINDNPIYREQLRRFAEFNAIPAVKGYGRSAELYRVACFGFDRGVSQEETTAILWELYNPRCEPPWTPEEYGNFERYVGNAYHHGKNAPGCKTATGIEWGVVPEPVGGWEKNQAIAVENSKTGKYDKDIPDMEYEQVSGDIAFITPLEAATNSTLITSKSTVYEHGLKFIGETYPNKTLLRFEKTFYAYNGKKWIELTDEYVLAQMTRFFACWMFPPSKVKNVFDIVVMQVFEDNLKRGIYLDDKDNEMVNSIIVNNGIININGGKAEFKPHNRNFFDLNMLPYDYDDKAKCPEFMKFINDLWPNNLEMHNQLQEMFGLCLMPMKEVQKFALIIGKSRGGKGVLREVITAMIGKHNITSPNLESIIDDPTVDKLATAKVAIVPEANAISHFVKDKVLNRLLAITGADSVQYQRKFKSSADCDLWPFMVLQANEFPDFANSSGALANRAWPFPLTQTFAGREDRGLSNRLCTPQSISGVFNWALDGLIRVLENNMEVTVCAESREYIDDIRYDTFPLAAFIEENCIIDPSAYTYVDELHQAYVGHARERGIKLPMGPPKFNKMLDASALPISKRREGKTDTGKRKYVFKGIALNDIAKGKAQKFPPIEPPTQIIDKKIK